MMPSSSATNIWAIVPSAGSGQRMNNTIPKQYLELDGSLVIEQTLSTLLAEDKIHHITVCVAKTDQHWDKLNLEKQTRVSSVVGGATRADSVLNGIRAISDRASADDWLLVHDAARPCLSSSMLLSFIEQLSSDQVGGILAMRSNDTVKFAKQADTSDNRIEKTLDRNKVWYAQTPQMFRYGLLKKSLEQAIESGASITDEASAIEMAGHNPKLISGESKNIKITRAEDLELASLLIKGRDKDKLK